MATVPLIHRDVKPDNILAVVEAGGLRKVLLADFGEAKQLTQSMTRARASVAGAPGPRRGSRLRAPPLFCFVWKIANEV